MYENIVEGKAKIRIKKAEKISRQMEVFYNPVMKLNRDISILLLNSVDKKDMQIALPLASSGVRGIRFLEELNKNKIKSISLNDYSLKAVISIINNLRLNNINKFTIIRKTVSNLNNNKNNNLKKNSKKILIYNNDANLFLLNSKGFDYIDIDPFGTSNSYLDSAIKRLSRGGILAVTNTDTAALTGTYPKVCIRKYWALPKRDYMMHEIGLRILIRKIQLIGMQYEKALNPIFSYFKDHYFRIFFRCIKGKKEADKIAKLHGMFNDAGPLWTGSLWDGKLANKIHSSLLKSTIKNKSTINNFNNENNDKIIFKNKRLMNKLNIKKNKSNKTIINNNQNNTELLKFLKIVKDESKINVVGFYDVHKAAKNKKMRIMMKKEDVIEKIKRKGFKASSTHFSGTGIRTNISYERFLKLL